MHDKFKKLAIYILFAPPAHIVEAMIAGWFIVFGIAFSASFSMECFPDVVLGAIAAACFLAGCSFSLVTRYENVPPNKKLKARFVDGLWHGNISYLSYALYRYMMSRVSRCRSNDDVMLVAESAYRLINVNKMDTMLDEGNWKDVLRMLEDNGLASYVEAARRGVPLEDLFV